MESIRISDELVIDIAPDGTVYGIELLNANEQLGKETEGRLLVVNEAIGEETDSCPDRNQGAEALGGTK